MGCEVRRHSGTYLLWLTTFSPTYMSTGIQSSHSRCANVRNRAMIAFVQCQAGSLVRVRPEESVSLHQFLSRPELESCNHQPGAQLFSTGSTATSTAWPVWCWMTLLRLAAGWCQQRAQNPMVRSFMVQVIVLNSKDRIPEWTWNFFVGVQPWKNFLKIVEIQV